MRTQCERNAIQNQNQNHTEKLLLFLLARERAKKPKDGLSEEQQPKPSIA